MVLTSVVPELGPRGPNSSPSNVSNVVNGSIKHKPARRHLTFAAPAEQPIVPTPAITKATSSAYRVNQTRTLAGIGSAQNSEGDAPSMMKDTQRTTWCTFLLVRTGC